MTENNKTTGTTAPTFEEAAAKAPASIVKGNVGPKERAAANAADRKAKAPAKPAAAKGKAPAKPAAAKPAAKGKAAAKPAAKGKAPAKPTTVLATKSGVSHPGPLWKALLEEKGMTRMACAKEMGVAPMTLHRYLEGNGIPTARVTVEFARVSGLNVKKAWAQVCDYELALVLEQTATEAK